VSVQTYFRRSELYVVAIGENCGPIGSVEFALTLKIAQGFQNNIACRTAAQAVKND